MHASRPTLTRRLADAQQRGWIEGKGGGPTRRYRLTAVGWQQIGGEETLSAAPPPRMFQSS
ncbi:MAG TPA: hypothetical protein VFS42_02980 [Burkholderiaceae bacterium]|nr:hypothetical protein [Burkholderiaceae bacterium]